MKLLICTQAVDANHPILGFFIGWIKEFSKHFDEVHVICLQKGTYELPSHVHVYSLGKEEGENKLKYLIRFYKYFSHIFFKIRVDFVFYHMGAVYNILGAPFFFIRKFSKTKFYWWKTHGYINVMGRMALLFVDRVYTASKESFPVASQKRFVVGHAVPIPEQFVPKDLHMPLRLLFAGRVTPVKKVELAVEALKELRARGIEATLRIVGSLPDQKYKDRISSLIASYGLASYAEIVGPLNSSALFEEYANTDVMLNPSQTYSIDKVVLEAMAHGLPVIAYAHAYGELLSPFGLAADAQDARVYAEVIAQLQERPDIHKLQEALKEEASAHHSLSTITQRIFSI